MAEKKSTTQKVVDAVKTVATRSKSSVTRKPRKKVEKVCPVCNGSGLNPVDDSQLCPECGGSGKV